MKGSESESADARFAMTEEKAREIIDSRRQDVRALVQPQQIHWDKYHEAKGYLAGLEHERARAKPLIEAATLLIHQFGVFAGKQHDLLVDNQTLETASENWKKYPEAFEADALEFGPLIEALNAYTAKEGSK